MGTNPRMSVKNIPDENRYWRISDKQIPIIPPKTVFYSNTPAQQKSIKHQRDKQTIIVHRADI